MSDNLTVKQERYAQELAKIEFDDPDITAHQREAFKRAYNTEGWEVSSIDVNASKYAKIAKIALRVKELRDFGSKYSLTAIANRLDRIASKAEEENQLSVASSTVQALGKLSGHFVEKTENKNENDTTINVKVTTFKKDE